MILEEDLAKNVSMSLHNSFCFNNESKVKVLSNQAKILQEQREWMRAYEQLEAWEEIVCRVHQGLVSQRRRARTEQDIQGLVLES